MTVIETSRLILSELKTEDAAFILKLYNDRDFIFYIGDKGIRSIKDAEKFIKGSDDKEPKSKTPEIKQKKK